jgi:multidrug efflux pump subunit AcrB
MNLKLSSFSILTIFICLTIVGASLIPLLSVQLAPSTAGSSISVDFSWQEASAKVIEQEVTSKLEGMFNTVKGVQELSSSSNKGYASINIQFKKNIDIDAVRFEIANLIRQSYSKLPEGVSYPTISMSSANENESPILSYSINASESSHYIKKYTENNILPVLTAIKGVNQVNVYGASPFEWVVKYKADKLLQLQITANEIQGAIENYLQEQELGSGILISDNEKTSHEISLVLAYKPNVEINWKMIPVKNIGSRIIYLGDIAEISFQEAPVSSYYRINGLNTVNMVVYAEKGVNTVDLAKEVKNVVSNIENKLPGGYSIRQTQDTTEYITQELQKTEIRTFFSLLILLVLIFLIYRSFKYLMVLFLSIVTNLLIAVIFYYLLGIELQLYSFAGVTISFGIIIDNGIVMIEHLRNKGDKKVFLSILAATLTTIGALSVVLLLPENQRVNLLDFSKVIVINLFVSLAVTLYFVPALLDKMKLNRKEVRFSRKRKRRVLNFTKAYIGAILLLRKPRFKWILILVLILGFGLPIQLLPNKMDDESSFANTYNETLGNEWFNNEIRPSLEIFFGGSLRLFVENVFNNSNYTEPGRTTLRVEGTMPEGCTIEQLNEVTMKMENFLGGFKEIELYETRIGGYRNSSISIYFKKDFEFGSFPYALKSMLESKAVSLGGLDWIVTGVGQGFSNALGSAQKSNQIMLEGYNYDKLYHYAELLKSELIKNSFSRITDVDITNGGWDNNALDEFYLDFNQEQLAQLDVSQSEIYVYLKDQVHVGGLSPIVQDNELQQVKLVSDNYKKFNVWDLKNEPIVVQNKQYKLNQLASIEKKKMGNSIQKNNQQYRLAVAYNFIGNDQLATIVKKKHIEELKTRLPIGYKVFEQSYRGWDKKDDKQYLLLFVVIFIIFFICAILLESLRQPFAIISLIPISFIGVFLTFYLFEFNFDQGGYAAFVLLCGISVNAALYIINDYNNFKRQYPLRNAQLLYFKAFNYKMIPVVLTIISTMVGLIPFVWGGQNEAFWFSFAAGSIGGLLFSLIGIFIYLPVFIVEKS